MQKLIDEVAWRQEVLNMIATRLVEHGCCCEANEAHTNTPPMNYDDWITCVVNHAAGRHRPTCHKADAQRAEQRASRLGKVNNV